MDVEVVQSTKERKEAKRVAVLIRFGKDYYSLDENGKRDRRQQRFQLQARLLTNQEAWFMIKNFSEMPNLNTGLARFLPLRLKWKTWEELQINF
jgi:hypothetical protein